MRIILVTDHVRILHVDAEAFMKPWSRNVNGDPLELRRGSRSWHPWRITELALA
jgi:hypothetical protein